MKIKVNNILNKILEKLNLRIIRTEEKGAVIKFETDNKTNDEHTRTGAINDEERGAKDTRIKKQGIKIAMSMIFLLVLTISLTYKENITLDKDARKEVGTISVSSSIDEDDTVARADKVVEEVLIFAPPLYGKIQKMYSTDKVIYSKTLEQWKTHDGIDIAASIGTSIKAAEKGVVDDIYTDNFLGKTIVIEHIAGYKTIYSNLDENVYVQIGESVIKGQKIAKIGNTAIGEYMDDPHLHFEVKQNNNSVNPTYIFE